MTEAFTIYEKHPHMDAYRVYGFYEPYAINAVDKRMSDAELAAEWHQQDNYCGQVVEGYSISHDGSQIFSSEESEIEKLRILYRFATSRSYDE